MNFLQRLFRGVSSKPEKRYYTFNVKCSRCGEIIEGRVDLDNDLSVEYENQSDTYFCHKVLMGKERCFQRVEVTFKFAQDRTLIEQEAKGGEFI
jgi:hypothetical protein